MTGGEALQISPEVNSEIGQNRQKTTISILSKYKKLRQVYSRQVLNFSKISEVCGSLVGLPVHPCPRLLGETALLRPRGDERQLPAQGGIQQCRGRMTQQGQVVCMTNPTLYLTRNTLKLTSLPLHMSSHPVF